jgi:hypothetical protein
MGCKPWGSRTLGRFWDGEMLGIERGRISIIGHEDESSQRNMTWINVRFFKFCSKILFNLVKE